MLSRWPLDGLFFSNYIGCGGGSRYKCLWFVLTRFSLGFLEAVKARWEVFITALISRVRTCTDY